MQDDTTTGSGFGDDVHSSSSTSSQSSTSNGAQGDDAQTDGALPSFTELEKLQADLTQAQDRINDLTETSKRAYADLSNYRRLVDQERAQYTAFANMNFIKEILPIADNFSRAFNHVPPEVTGTEWYKGMQQIANQMNAFLKKQGVEEIPTIIGMAVDPNIHEPLMTGPGKKDSVIEEFEKGYTLGGQVLRPAKVKVGNGE